VDGKDPVSDPTGLAGAVLEAQVLVLSASAFAVENLARAARLAGRHPSSFVVAPAAVGLGAVSAEERALGALVIDLGAGSTGFAAWVQGGLRLCGCIPVGSEHVTRDLAVGLGVSREVAEGLKRRSATAHSASLGADEANEVLRAPSLAGPEPRLFSRGELAEIVEARVEEMLLLVARRVAALDPARDFGAGVVLAGGGARQKGAEEKAREIFGTNARAARPALGGGRGRDLAAPENALAAGLLMWSSGGAPQRRPARPLRPVSWIANAFRWLAAGF
jgi:cell division protein FtsA